MAIALLAFSLPTAAVVGARMKGGARARVLAMLVLLLAAGFGRGGSTLAEVAGDHPEAAPSASRGDFRLPTPSEGKVLEPLDESQPVVATDRFNSARVCGACHKEIFDYWSRSMHAFAYEDPIFKSAFLKAYYYTGGEAAALCLRCHSPTVTETKDFLGKQDITREGITCDYCHSITGITQDGNGKTSVTIDHSNRHSPFVPQGKPPAAHGVVSREYFRRSELCASCHDYNGPNGVAVFSTYSEWKTSPYAAAGKECQECHMPRLQEDGRGPTGATVINDHNLVGGHSPAQLMRAVSANIREVVRDGDRVRVVVTIQNSGAGHYVPTGLPSRTLVLGLTALQRNHTIFQQEIVYQRVMQGPDFHSLSEDWQIKLLSKSVLRDNRLRPGETRNETFIFDAAPNDDVIVRAQVTYRYRPKIDREESMEAPIANLEQVLARGL